MLKSVVAITSLLIAAGILYAGNGLQGTLLAVRGGLEGFAPTAVGLLMSAYYAGFIVGCRLVPRVIRAVGHIRCFVALASIASSSALAHALFVDMTAWALLRGITGFSFAGLAMVLESWINDRATNQNRGRVLSVYRIVDLLALTIGNLLLATASPEGFQLFALVSILFSIALVPVATTQLDAPAPIQRAELHLLRLYQRSPVAACGALATGLANAAFWGVAPLFVQAAGFPSTLVATFMSVAILGAAVCQLPLGWLSDKLDRRRIVAVIALLAGISALLIAWIGVQSQWALLALGALFGSAALPVYGISAAHAADHAPVGQSVATSGGMLMIHGLGAVIGAALGGASISLFGASALFYYIAAIEFVLVAITVLRIARREPPAPEDKRDYVPAPRVPTTRTHEPRR